MLGFNRVFLSGYVGSKPETYTAKNGSKYARFSLATHRIWNDHETSEKQERTEWHRIMVWGRKVDIAINNIDKGSALAIEGRLSQFQREDESKGPLTQTTVIADQIHLFPRTKDPAGPSDQTKPVEIQP